jgi:hypothetical protein
MKNLDFSHEEHEAETVIPQPEHNSQAVDTASNFDLSVVTALDTTPGASEATTLVISQIAAIDISPETPKVPLMTISQAAAINISPITPQTSLLAISQVKAIYDYRPIHEDGGDSESCSRRQILTAGVCQTTIREASDSIITDTNHGLPIIIDDTDDEIPENKAKPRVNGLARTTIRCSESQSSEPNPSRRCITRKRARTEHRGEVQWARPEYEKCVLSDLRSAFYRHESLWVNVRELPEAVEDAKVKQHDILVQEFGKTCRETEAVLIEDTLTLRQSYIDLKGHLFTVLGSVEDRSMVEELGRFVDEIQDHVTTLSSIYACRVGDSDTRDKTYRPSKKRRS